MGKPTLLGFSDPSQPFLWFFEISATLGPQFYHHLRSWVILEPIISLRTGVNWLTYWLLMYLLMIFTIGMVSAYCLVQHKFPRCLKFFELGFLWKKRVFVMYECPWRHIMKSSWYVLADLKCIVMSSFIRPFPSEAAAPITRCCSGRWV